MSKRFKKLSHTIYECKYHFAICPKYRFRIFKGERAEYIKQQTYILCHQKELTEILELNIQLDHIHLVMSIPPKYSLSSVKGTTLWYIYINKKNAHYITTQRVSNLSNAICILYHTHISKVSKVIHHRF